MDCIYGSVLSGKLVATARTIEAMTHEVLPVTVVEELANLESTAESVE